MDTMLATSPSTSHPYGVKPIGNSMLANETERNVKPYGLGSKLCYLSDESIIEILGYLNGIELAQISLCSRILYVFAMTSDLWRDITLRLINKSISYNKTWRDTYVQEYLLIHKKEFKSSYIHKPIVVSGAYSDLLHRFWTCHSFDIEVLCPGFFSFEDIDRIDSSKLTLQEFVDKYESTNTPVVITNAASNWNSLVTWTQPYLESICQNAQFRATSATAPEAASFSIHEYFTYANQTQEEVPLYLFERDFLKKVPALVSDFTVPSYFNSFVRPTTDLFRILGDSQRPDYQWLVAGPKRSGSIFHIDPNQTNAWNVSIKGRKKWIFYPPGVCPPGVVASDDGTKIYNITMFTHATVLFEYQHFVFTLLIPCIGADVTVPLSTGEWLLSFWKHHLHQRTYADPSQRPLEIIANPGDVVFVPHGFWHMVVNLDDCIAITQNYVSTSNLVDCLRFLRDSTDQISGIRDRPDEALHPEEVYDRFITRLKDVIPPDQLNKYIEDSYLPSTLDVNYLKGKSTKRKNLIHHKRDHRKMKTSNTTTADSITSTNDSTSEIFSFGFDL